ncbi:TetR/AcrR family transcriptional regulator [Peribacillus cavernae]|uniref:TetR/AcrR family transcriptional regulator n=1 Tax=Peribacillus cavernae TaxID=1674310 RepID=A0A3S0VLF6_9BACI|nr:TetR/AcrR family transcriptional regulator [Peribacillus cavernae]MDQ0217309.1 AcrR family transcriptional regulator [Peribacillus cavernae]RUQ30230.1 TetR/AcrR family transcriptional regulator [Peribacillus cavernae]
MKAKITEHSVRLFEKKGFSETSIQDIVDSIGVTKGTFYYYFSSKEELLMDIHFRYIDELLKHQEKIFRDETKSYKQKLYDIILMLLSNIKSQGASAKVFFREMQNLSEERLSQIIPKRDQFRFNIQAILEEGIKKGEFRQDLNAEIVTFGILGIANWSYEWFNPEGSMSEKEVTDIFVEMFLKGIERD